MKKSLLSNAIVLAVQIASILALMLYTAGKFDFESTVIVFLYCTFIIVGQIYNNTRGG